MSIVIRSEVTIDLDDKRRIWAESSAEIEAWPADDEDQSKLLTDLGISAANSALHSYNTVRGRPGPKVFKEGKLAEAAQPGGFKQ